MTWSKRTGRVHLWSLMHARTHADPIGPGNFGQKFIRSGFKVALSSMSWKLPVTVVDHKRSDSNSNSFPLVRFTKQTYAFFNTPRIKCKFRTIPQTKFGRYPAELLLQWLLLPFWQSRQATPQTKLFLFSALVFFFQHDLRSYVATWCTSQRY